MIDLLSYVTKKTASCRTECGKFIWKYALYYFYVFGAFFCDLLISDYVSTQCPHLARSYFQKTIDDSIFCFSFSGRRSGAGGGGSVLHEMQWKYEIMSFLMISHQFSLQGWFLFWVLWHFYFPLRTYFYFIWITVELYIHITNNNNNNTKTICKQSPVVIVVTLQVCAKVYVCIWMYVLEDFLETFFVFDLFFYSLGVTGVHCELYSEGLDIPSFIDFRNAEH